MAQLEELTAAVNRRKAVETPVEQRAARAAPASAPPVRAHRMEAPPLPSEAVGETAALKAGARRILDTLAKHHPMSMTRSQLGVLSKFKISGGTFQTYWSTLKRAGLVAETSGTIEITPAGLAQAGVTPGEPMTTEEVLGQWRSVLKAGARQMLDVLVEDYPRAMSRQELAERVSMTATGGTFQTYLSTLKRNGLADVDSVGVSASKSLFLNR